MYYIAGGHFKCHDCETEAIDDFGLVKDYIDEHGASPAIVISEETGVPMEIINGLLRNGRVEIPEGSKMYIKCEKCGCSIRYGRYCMECAKAATNSMKGIYFNPDVGERPKKDAPQDNSKMHFLGFGETHDYRRR